MCTNRIIPQCVLDAKDPYNPWLLSELGRRGGLRTARIRRANKALQEQIDTLERGSIAPPPKRQRVRIKKPTKAQLKVIEEAVRAKAKTEEEEAVGAQLRTAAEAVQAKAEAEEATRDARTEAILSEYWETIFFQDALRTT